MKFLLKTALCVCVAILTACSSDELVEEQTSEKLVTMTAPDFKYAGESRTSLEITPDGGKFTWSKNDTIGIFPDKGRQVDFPMTSGYGTNEAYFNGGGWALRPSSTYSAYYPMQGKFYLDKTAIPVSYEGQIQIGDASSAHLGKYDFMTAKTTTTASIEDNINFDFQHLGCIVRLVITLPKAKPILSVTISAPGQPFITKGTIDLTAAIPTIKPVSTSSSISLELKNVSTSADTKTATAYMMIAPTNLSGQTIDVVAGGYKTSVDGKDFKAGYAYSLSIDANKPAYPKDLWVDLGLPSKIKWASHNIGTTVPEGYGDYFSWGEIAPKKTYYSDNSLTSNKEMGSIEGNINYDAAAAIWGDPVRMPTSAEVQELIDNTTREWTTLNGVNGCKLTSKLNKNSIFLPAAGYFSAKSVVNEGNWGFYWTASPQSSKFSYTLNFASGFFNLNWYDRAYGMPIRPIMK